MSKPGYLYCLHNVMFNYVSPNLYKLGKSNDVTKRLASYATSFLDKCEIKYSSEQVKDYDLAEKYLFFKLNQYRNKTDREFFECELATIIETMKDVIAEVNDGTMTNEEYKKLAKEITYDKLKAKWSNEMSNRITNQEIAEAKDITKKEYVQIISLPERSRIQRAQIKRHNFAQIWRTNNIDKEFIDTWRLTKQAIVNLRILLGTELGNVKQCKNNYRVKMILHTLGYCNNTVDLDKWVPADSFREAMFKVMKKCYPFTDSDKCRRIFKCKQNEANTLKSFLGSVNTLLKEWGLVISLRQKTHRIKIEGKRTNKPNNFYKLNYISNINQYL